MVSTEEIRGTISVSLRGRGRPGRAPETAQTGRTRGHAIGERRARRARASRAGRPGYGPLPALLLTLTVVTGVVDAVSILALGRVFVANMTGNVVFAAFALVGAPGFSLSASLFALAGFLVGAYAGGALITRHRQRPRACCCAPGCAVELGLAAVALALAAASGDPGASHGTLGTRPAARSARAVTDALAALLAVALGVQNAVARKLAVPDMTTTVLTMTLTGVGADLRAVFGRESRVPGAAPAAGRRPGRARPPAARGRRHGRRRRRGRVAGPAGEPAVRPGPGDGPAASRRRAALACGRPGAAAGLAWPRRARSLRARQLSSVPGRPSPAPLS